MDRRSGLNEYLWLAWPWQEGPVLYLSTSQGLTLYGFR